MAPITARTQQHLADVLRINGSSGTSGKISPIIERGLRNLDALGEYDNTTAHVSAASKCKRQMYLTLTGHRPEPHSLDTLVNFAVGRAVEQFMKAAIAASYPDAELYEEVAIEIPNGDGPTVPGHIDLLAVIDGKPIAFEIKGINSRAMSWMLKKGEQGKADHRSQINLYHHAALIGAEARDVDTGRLNISPWAYAPWYLVYVVYDGTKGEPRIFDFLVPYESALAERDLKYIAQVNQHARIGLDPGIPELYSKTAYPCSYCDFREFCWTNKDSIIPAANAVNT